MREAVQIDFLLHPLGLGNEGKHKSGALKLEGASRALRLTSCTAQERAVPCCEGPLALSEGIFSGKPQF